MLTYKVQLYPSKQQQAKFIEQLDICRKLYNKLLEEYKKAREKGEKITQIKTQSFIVSLKNNSMPELKGVYSKVLQMVNYTLWANIKSLSKLKKNGHEIGHLRFKGKGWYKTINYNQSGFKIDEHKNKLTFSKIGTINCRGLNNRVRKNTIKGIILKRTQMGRWFANIQVENTPLALPRTNKSVGIDVGVSSFIVDSNGRRVENPKNIDKQLKKIKVKQRTLARKNKDSKNWLKAKVQLAKLLEQVTNQRKDFLHKISRFYIESYDLICVEDLNIIKLSQKGNKNNKRSRTLHRNILDASWGQFFNYLSYKAENADKEVVKVHPKGTTQECSRCGRIVKKNLSTRIHLCPHCDLELDRDYNASINILKRGTGCASILVENRPLYTISASAIVSGQVFSMNQETPSLR